MFDQLQLLMRAVINQTEFSTKAEGDASTERDLKRAMMPWGGADGQFSTIQDSRLRLRLRAYLWSMDYDILKKIFASWAGKSGMTMQDFSESLHHNAQDRRGRVGYDHHTFVPQVSEWNQYLRRLQANVGRARGGWALSAELLGIPQPSWVTRHASGGYVSLVEDSGHTTIIMGNSAIFMPRYNERIELALRVREQALVLQLQKLLSQQAARAGLELTTS